MEIAKPMNRELLAERDARIFALKKAGVSSREIAKRFDMTTSAISKAIQRQLEKLNQESRLNYVEVLRMELERLDALQASIWPMTQNRKQANPDGSEVTIEPDLKAVQQVLSVMDRRAKLLGMDRMNVNVSLGDSASVSGQVKIALAGSEKSSSDIDIHSPEEDARRLIALMTQAGILPSEELAAVASSSGVIIDAEEIMDTTIRGDDTSDE
jgi:DNA-binding CsgD family transcriptional regulator